MASRLSTEVARVATFLPREFEKREAILPSLILMRRQEIRRLPMSLGISWDWLIRGDR